MLTVVQLINQWYLPEITVYLRVNLHTAQPNKTTSITTYYRVPMGFFGKHKKLLKNSKLLNT